MPAGSGSAGFRPCDLDPGVKGDLLDLHRSMVKETRYWETDGIGHFAIDFDDGTHLVVRGVGLSVGILKPDPFVRATRRMERHPYYGVVPPGSFG